MEGFIEFIQEWGYIAVLLGAMVEGESVILTSCIMAYQGYLSLPKIMIIAFLGTLFADQALYYVGRIYGDRFFKRFPKTKITSKRAFDLLHKWDLWFILIFRFIYGIRILSPIVIGAAGVTPQRFIPLNILAAVIWTVVSCTAGYMLGGVFDYILENFESLKMYLAIIPVALLGLWFLLYTLLFKKRGSCHDSHPTPNDHDHLSGR